MMKKTKATKKKVMPKMMKKMAKPKMMKKKSKRGGY
tara:strand:+ start:89 stop:196 length:108 start_codon:yes stop_codon:yes gene_type:complete